MLAFCVVSQKEREGLHAGEILAVHENSLGLAHDCPGWPTRH